MGLEAGTRIEDLDGNWPLGTDPKSEAAPTGAGPGHFNLIKNCLQGSLPNLGSAAVQATAAEIDLAITSIQPTDDLDSLADVGYLPSPPINGDILVFQGSVWAPVAQAAAKLEGTAQYTGFSSSVGSQIVFATTVSDTVPAGLATIVNSAGATGWILTAVVDLELNLSLQGQCKGTYAPLDSGGIDFSLGITKDPANTLFLADQGEAHYTWLNSSNGKDFNDIRSTIAIIKVAAGEVINLCTDRSTTGDSPSFDTRDFNCTLSVKEI